MIVTVTMNPAIDKTIEIDDLVLGGLNRIQKIEYDAGGKGINVSKTIHALGGNSIATGFVGGNAGRTIERVLCEMGIFCDFVHVEGITRTNTKVLEKSGVLTELNEPGPVIAKEDIELLLQKLDSYAKEDTLFILSGSVPIGVSDEIYGQIIRRVHEKGSKVLLDAEGDLFVKALSALPDMIKPNHTELSKYAGMNALVSKDKLKEIGTDFLKKGIETVVISMGADGAIFLWDGSAIESFALSVKVHSTVGAGDAMVAALAYAWENRLDKEETVKLCMAVSAGAVMTNGTKPPSVDVVEVLKKQVILNYQ